MKKVLKEWGVTVGIVVLLWATGWYRPVMGVIQRGLLATGFYRPSIESVAGIPADFSLQFVEANGEVHSLAEYKGETILINIWATWCPPCRAELPDMENLYNTEEGQAIRWLMVSRDQNLQKAVDFLQKGEYPWSPVQVVGSLPAVYQSEVVPTTFVISPRGQVVVRREGMAQYNTKEFKAFLREISVTD